MLIPRPWLAVLFGVALIVAVTQVGAVAQESKPTIHHHRVAEQVPDDSSSPEVDQAETAMQRRDFTTAESLLQKAVTAKPNDYRAWFDLGYIYARTQRPPLAINAYKKSIAAKPDVFESNLDLGLLLAHWPREGESAEEAAKYLRAATQLKPTAHPQESLMNAWLALGRVLEPKEPTQALLAYAEASKVNPKHPQPHVFAGLFYETHVCRICIDSTTESRLNFAATEYKAALAVDPTSRDALLGLDRIYESQKNYAEAEIWLRKLVALNPTDHPARLYLAQVLSAEGKDDEAVEQLKASLQDNPADRYASLALGKLYLKADKDAEAEPQLRLAVKELPQDAEAHYALGSLLMHEKKYPEAQQELLATLKLKPDLADAYGNLAVVASANQNYELALKALDYRAKFLPEPPASYFLRATCFDQLKAVPQAVEYYQRFLAADEGKLPDQEWQARHRLIALDPRRAEKYQIKKK
jgi:tetratricopeptide (TPR) repeat protein